MNMSNGHFYGCIDIGGTKIRLGLVDRNGRVVFRKMFLTPVRESWDAVIDLLLENFKDMLRDAGISFKQLPGIGVGCPGTFDAARETISFAPNLNWRNIPIKEYLSERLPVPVWLENDTNLSTLGVAHFGEGRSKNSLLGIFIGTGIGGGIILNKELFTGSTGGAGEIGHMVVRQNGPKCSCGNRGCLESIASTRAIYGRLHASYMKHHRNNDVYADFIANANKSLAVKLAYNSGEPVAVKVVNEALFTLGMGIVSLINILNPEMIVLGGGLSEALGDVMLERVSGTVTRHAMPGTFEKVQIVRTCLGDDAPIAGAAALVKYHMK